MTFKINVAHLLKQPVGEAAQCQVVYDGVKGEIDLMRTPRSLLVTGHLEAASRNQCSRCLEDFDLSLGLDMEEEFYPSVDVGTGRPLPRPEDADAFLIDEHQEIDLGEAVRQYALLAQPMKPLCRQDCRGLCPQCGANLNWGPCSCLTAMDPRWSRLRGLSIQAKE